MTSLDPTFGPTFRPHDRVSGHDLTEWQRVPLFAAARHFRGLHRLYGVADGLVVKLAEGVPGQESKSTYAIRVSPGVAFDAYGRPMCLHAETDTPFNTTPPNTDTPPPKPATAAETHLLVLRGTEPEIQQLGVPVPAPQACEVRLIDPTDLQLWDVALAALSVSRTRAADGKPLTIVVALDLGQRAVAVRTFGRPYIATGTLPSGTTAVPLTSATATTGWTVWVDTSAAGFLPVAAPADPPESAPAGSPPVYLVTVGRQTADDAARLRNGQQVLNDASTPATEPPTIAVSTASPRGFLLTVDYGAETGGLKDLTATPLEITWTGVEERVEVRKLKRKPDTVKTEGVTVSQTTDRPSYPWPVFRDGQRLQTADLNDLQETVRKLQRLHNRALHDWGVIEGCAVAATTDRRGVRVQPGTALDVAGRELVVPDELRLGVPAQKVIDGPSGAKQWWVTAAYRDAPAPRDTDPSRRMQGEPFRRLPVAAVRWRDPDANEHDDRLEPGYDVILATVVIDNGEVQSVVSTGRRSAVPPKRPHISAGRSGPASRLVHEKWSESIRTFEFEIEIDTSAGGFVTTPSYTIQVEWKSGVELKMDEPGSDKPDGIEWAPLYESWRRVEVRSVTVVEAKPASVRLFVRFRMPPEDAKQLAAATRPQEGWWRRAAVYVGLLQPRDSVSLLELTKEDEGEDEEKVKMRKRKKWLKDNLVRLLPVRFAWVGIEV